jgi:hypothetical protein
MTLVQIDGGTAPPYAVELPESGTVFRISQLSRGPSHPELLSPANETLLETDSITFYWMTKGERSDFQLSRTADFSALVYDFSLVDSGLRLQVPDKGLYFWRIRTAADGSWSATWSFTTLEKPGTAKNDDPVAEFRAFPNPASGPTTIQFYLRESGEVSLTISDALGRRVATPLEGYRLKGMTYVPLEAGDLPAGVYFCTVRVSGFSTTKTLVVAR